MTEKRIISALDSGHIYFTIVAIVIALFFALNQFKKPSIKTNF